ncbi:actin family [Globomyces pollinis-pini]|nr:actin family [Globomyces pollinis-pini]
MTFYPRDTNIIVLDPGSYSTQLGKADYLAYPTISAKTVLNKQPVIDHGLIRDFNHLSRFWSLLLQKHGVIIEKNEFPTFLNIPITWSKNDIELVIQIMFENLNTPGLFLLQQPLATLYGVGIVSGVVIDIGYHTTDITPVIENNIIYNAQKTVPIGGADIDNYLNQLLLQQNMKYDIPTVIQIKEKSAIVAISAAAIDEITEVTVEINEISPLDGSTDSTKPPNVVIGSIRSRCCEVLFDPTLVNKQCISIAEAISVSISQACEAYRRQPLWESLVLTGGCSKLNGINARLEAEFQKLNAISEHNVDNQGKEVKWIKIPDYMTSYKDCPAEAGFLGGAISAKLVFGSGGQGYISKSDYHEQGPSVYHSKGF